MRLRSVTGTGKDPEWAEQGWREPPYVFAVQLTAKGCPTCAKLKAPGHEALQHFEAGVCVVLARCDALVRQLALAADPSFPNKSKLQQVLQMIVEEKALSMPIVQTTGVERLVSGFRLQTGRHRILMLHELGATRVPVAVPRDGITDLLRLIG